MGNGPDLSLVLIGLGALGGTVVVLILVVMYRKKG
jgi:hypothetical protein